MKKTATFRGVLSGVKVTPKDDVTSLLELTVTTNLITINGKIQVIERNPIDFTLEVSSASHDVEKYRIGDMVKITVKETAENNYDFEEITCLPTPEHIARMTKTSAGKGVSFKEVIRHSRTYQRTKKGV